MKKNCSSCWHTEFTGDIVSGTLKTEKKSQQMTLLSYTLTFFRMAMWCCVMPPSVIFDVFCVLLTISLLALGLI